MLKKVWNDPVWSKVIAAGILAGIALVGSYFAGLWAAIQFIATWFLETSQVANWLLLALILCTVFAVGFLVLVTLTAVFGIRMFSRKEKFTAHENELKESVSSQIEESLNQFTIEEQSVGSCILDRDVWLRDAIYYAIYGEWRSDVFQKVTSGEKIEELTELIIKHLPQKAYDGQLPVWGKEEGRGLWKPVPREFWDNNGIDWFSLIGGAPEDMRTEPKRTTRPTPHWSALMTNKTIVEALWPTTNT